MNELQAVREVAAKETQARTLEKYGGGSRRKPVQVSSIPSIDRFAEKSEALARKLGVDGRSVAAIVAVSYVCDLLGIAQDGKDKEG